eukprot:sb/3474742/
MRSCAITEQNNKLKTIVHTHTLMFQRYRHDCFLIFLPSVPPVGICYRPFYKVAVWRGSAKEGIAAHSNSARKFKKEFSWNALQPPHAREPARASSVCQQFSVCPLVPVSRKNVSVCLMRPHETCASSQLCFDAS